MPVYEYICATCNHKFDYYHKIQNEDPPGCPKCGNKVKKIFSLNGIDIHGLLVKSRKDSAELMSKGAKIE